MANEAKPFHDYIEALQKKLALGDATEHTHRPALQALIESLYTGVTATIHGVISSCAYR